MTTKYETTALPQNIGKQRAIDTSYLISTTVETQNLFLPLILQVCYR